MGPVLRLHDALSTTCHPPSLSSSLSAGFGDSVPEAHRVVRVLPQTIRHVSAGRWRHRH